MSDDTFVEATGETVGEAKWAALRELERLRPDLDKTAVRFEVLTEGERGLLGVGYAPARVVATVAKSAAGARPAPPPVEESDLASEVRSIVDRIVSELDAATRVEVREDADGIHVDCVGGDAGVLIGRHGQTIDAMQYVVNAIVAKREGERVEVTVDAAGYRRRRRETLEQLALRSAERARSTGRSVELEPMSAAERKIVHLCLQDLEGVATSSAGMEPNRYVVVSADVDGTA